MSIREKNITEEEKIAGYTPNETGDETFALENLESYPGVLPDFTYIEEPLIPGESLFQDDDSADEFDSEEDFGDLSDELEDVDDEANFDFGDEVDEESASEESLDESDTSESISGAFEDSDGDFDAFSEYSEDDESEFDNSIFDEDENEVDKENDVDSGIEELSEEEIAALESNNPDEEQGLQLDDTLKGLVESELQRGSERKANEFSFDEYQESVPRDDFPIDEDMSASVMNFNDIDADKPSNFGIDKLTDEEENKKEEVKEEVKKDEKKKSNKKMLYVYSSIAAVLLLTMLTIAILNKDTLFNSENIGNDSTLVDNVDGNSSNSISRNENKVNNKEIEKDKSNEISKKDDKITEKNLENVEDLAENNDKKDVKSNEENKKVQKINLPKIDEVEEKTKSKSISSLSPKLKSENKKIQSKKLDVKENTKVNEKVITNTENKRKSSDKKITENNDIAKNNTEKATISKSSEVNNKLSYPKKEKSDEGLFVIQIYASQSKEDAIYWLNKLKNQNINDGFISEQIVRDEIWYRVRFGSFSTKTEAMEKASKLGYAQTWVDRVK